MKKIDSVKKRFLSLHVEHDLFISIPNWQKFDPISLFGYLVAWIAAIVYISQIMKWIHYRLSETSLLYLFFIIHLWSFEQLAPIHQPSINDTLYEDIIMLCNGFASLFQKDFEILMYINSKAEFALLLRVVLFAKDLSLLQFLSSIFIRGFD